MITTDIAPEILEKCLESAARLRNTFTSESVETAVREFLGALPPSTSPEIQIASTEYFVCSMLEDDAGTKESIRGIFNSKEKPPFSALTKAAREARNHLQKTSLIASPGSTHMALSPL